MPITSSCFLEWSDAMLQRDDQGETEHRIIVSRSYYSAFHEALYLADEVLNIGVGNLKGGTHINLSDSLSRFVCDDKDKQKTIRRIGVRLHSLHAMRVRSDYHLDSHVTAAEAEAQVKNVKDVFHIIENELQQDAA